MQSTNNDLDGLTLFSYPVSDLIKYGVLEFDENSNVINIEEKPEKPKSNYAITGIYFHDNNVVEMAKKLRPSKRDELEITDLNNLYVKQKK